MHNMYMIQFVCLFCIMSACRRVRWCVCVCIQALTRPGRWRAQGLRCGHHHAAEAQKHRRRRTTNAPLCVCVCVCKYVNLYTHTNTHTHTHTYQHLRLVAVGKRVLRCLHSRYKGSHLCVRVCVCTLSALAIQRQPSA